MRAAGVEVTFHRETSRSRHRLVHLKKSVENQRPQRPQRPPELKTTDADRTLDAGADVGADAGADAGSNTRTLRTLGNGPFLSGDRARGWLNHYPDGWVLVDQSGCGVTNDRGEEVGFFSTREAALAWAKAHDVEVIER